VKQIYPASITGKSFAAGGSVLDHAYGQGEPYTLGVEEEYMLLDAETFDLVQHIDTVLAAVHGHELEASINPELMQSTVEIATPVCRTAADVEAALRSLRGAVCSVAHDKGLRVGSAGTHPYSLFERQRITARDRYRNLVDQLQYIARRELIFGMHVHVAVDDPEKAVQVVNGLLNDIAGLLALSASSPYWNGADTGYASIRTILWQRWPTAGRAPLVDSFAAYDRLWYYANQHGVQVQFSLTGPVPAWASSKHRKGVFNPNPGAFKEFARQLARMGEFPRSMFHQRIPAQSAALGGDNQMFQ